MKNPIVSVILGSYNRLGFLKITVESIRNELKNEQHEIVGVDGGSTDGTLRWLMKQKDIISIVQHNNGFWHGKRIEKKSWGYFMNLGFRVAKSKYICMVSDDCLIVPGAIKNGIEFFENELKVNEKIAAVPFFWRNWPEETEYRVGVTLGENIFVNHGLYLKKALEKVGYIDEDSFSFYHADGDLCLKLWHAGFNCKESQNSYIEHYSHANLKVRKSNLKRQEDDRNAYMKKWNGVYEENKQHWIEKQYADKSNIADKFKYVDLFHWYITRKIQNLTFYIVVNKLPKPVYNFLRNIYNKFN